MASGRSGRGGFRLHGHGRRNVALRGARHVALGEEGVERDEDWQYLAKVGCDVAQIAKSIIFRNAADGTSVLVITSGANRVDEKKVTALTGITLAKADANFVREQTGYAIGGVPPIAHARPGTIVMDEDLFRFATVFPAGGTPHAMFEVATEELGRLSGARVGAVRV